MSALLSGQPVRYQDLESELGNGQDAKKMAVALVGPATYRPFDPDERPSHTAVASRRIVNALAMGIKEMAAEWALSNSTADKAARGRAMKIAKEKAHALIDLAPPLAKHPRLGKKEEQTKEHARKDEGMI